MLQNGEWELIIGNNPFDDFNLVAEVTRNNTEVLATVTGEGGTRKIRWYKTAENIDIPFDWFLEAMKMADNRIS